MTRVLKIGLIAEQLAREHVDGGWWGDSIPDTLSARLAQSGDASLDDHSVCRASTQLGGLSPTDELVLVAAWRYYLASSAGA